MHQSVTGSTTFVRRPHMQPESMRGACHRSARMAVLVSDPTKAGRKTLEGTGREFGYLSVGGRGSSTAVRSSSSWWCPKRERRLPRRRREQRSIAERQGPATPIARWGPDRS